MPSIKLSKYIRDQITSTMISHRFKPEIKAQWPQWADLAVKFYDRLYCSSDQKKMRAMPDGWLPEFELIFVKAGAQATQLLFNGALANCHRLYVKGLERPEPVMFRFQARHHDHNISVVVEATDSLAIEHDRLLAEHRGLQERLQRASCDIEAALNSYSSTTALVRDWPEAEPFIPIASRPVQQIAIRRTDLNELLGLPIAEKVSS